MKKLCLLMLLLFLAACASKKQDNVVVTNEIQECYYPDAPGVSAPVWICGAKVEGIAVSAVGVAKKTTAGVNFMLQQASANARIFLAQQIQSNVTAMVKNYAETTGDLEFNNETVDQVSSLTSKVITQQSLIGTKIFKQITSPNGNLYVLVGLDQDSYSAYITNTMNTSYSNNNAQWQRVVSEKSFEDLRNSLADVAAK